MAVERGNYSRSLVWFHIAFALTGVGTTLLGCILPALSIAWHLDDRSAGILFASQFAGSASGALLVGKDFFRSVVRGYLLLICGAVLLTFFSGLFEIPPFVIFGLGLGLTMTATSMLIGSAPLPNRGAALSVLNAAWGVGAVASPLIATVWVKRWPAPTLFFVFAIAVMLTFVFVRKPATVSVGRVEHVAQSTTELGRLRLLSVFAVIGFLYVGTETSISGWMMTYVGRLPISSKMWAPIATSCFWVALLCGRMLVPMVVRWWSEAQLLTASLLGALLCSALLLLSRAPLAIVLSASLAGFMLAPIFPLALAKVLRVAEGSPTTKVVFAISGLGGAALPWITGELSARTGSLRIGLVIPVFALATMIILNRVASTSPTLCHQN